MTETSNRLSVRLLAAVALALPACNLDAAGQIPCVEDVSCPNDYPVCGPAGKCIAGTSNAGASVAVVGADGHAAADFLSGTVRVLVSARASTGVKTVALSSGSVNFTSSASAAAPPLYAFDVNTTALADGDAPLTATLTAGDGTTGTASGTLHVDNAKPTITAFTVAGGTSAAVTSGKTIAIAATFSAGTATITSSAGGSVSVTSGASVLVGPDASSTFKLRVTSRSGVIVQSGSTGQPPDVAVNVVAPATFTGTASVSPSAIQQGTGSGNFTFTAPGFGASVVAADVKDSTDAVVATISTSGGTAQVPIPDTAPGTTQLNFKVVLRNGATTPDTVSFPLVVVVGSPPVIAAFTGSAPTITSGTSASLQATFTGGSGIITPGNIPILSGGSAVVAPTSTTTYKLTVTDPATSASVSSGTAPPDVTVTVVPPPAVTSFVPSSLHVSSADLGLTFAIATTGVTGNAAVAGTCSPAATVTPFTITLAGGAGTSAPQTAPVVSATSTCTYTATVQNGPGTSVVARAVVTVEPVPTIATFQFQSTGTQSAFFALHADVVLVHTYNAQGGTASINGVAAGAATTTFANLRIDTVYTLTVTNLAGKSVTSAPATASVAPGNWSALNTNTFTVRVGATVTALDNGKVLIAGGLDLAGAPQKTAHVCDATGACTLTATDMSEPRAFHTATKVPQTAANNGGKVLVAGGFKASGPLAATTTADFYDQGTNSFTATTAITAGTVTSARARHVAVLLGPTGAILIAGGTSDDGTTLLNTALKYNAGAAPPTTANVLNTMALARMNFTGTLLGSGSVLIVGGRTGNLASDRTAELFDPAAGTGTFSNTGALPSGEDKRSHTAVLIQGASGNVGKVLISGGVVGAGAGTPSATQFLFSGATFAAAPSLATARSNHAAISLATDSVLLCGGTSNGTNTLPSCERYDPATGLGTVFPTAAMIEARKDFGLAPINISSVVEILASGSPASPMNYAETYNTN